MRNSLIIRPFSAKMMLLLFLIKEIGKYSRIPLSILTNYNFNYSN